MTETLSPTLPADVEMLLAVVLKAACDQHLKLATAESCTGGLLASLLTDVEGCAHAFDRGFVVYTDQAKTDLVGVAPALLGKFTAVSAPVAEAMAAGALARSAADIALSITGFAGRGGADEEPGLVFFGLARTGWPTWVAERHFGDVGRGEVRLACLRAASELVKSGHLKVTVSRGRGRANFYEAVVTSRAPMMEAEELRTAASGDGAENRATLAGEEVGSRTLLSASGGITGQLAPN